MPGDEVCVVLDGFDAVGVNAWLAGGWGVDALWGVQTRHHHDLDVVIANSDDSRMIVAGGLAALGYVMVREEKYEGLPMPVRWVFDDDRGHIVDIHPVDLLSRPFASNGHLGLPTFALGAVRDRAVRCLSASLQRELHTNYPLRAVDRRDLVRLIESEGRVLGEQCGEGTSEKL
jgi:lincosamide nucleotidyltransferase A/C/D/E